MFKPMLGRTYWVCLMGAVVALACGKEGTNGSTESEVELQLASCGVSADLIRGCTNAAGSLRILPGSQSCRPGENSICWNRVGPAGSNSLTIVTVLPVGHSRCPAGGSKVSAGLDSNGNGTLDPAEATSFAYVCNGTTGAAGPQGPQGDPGTAGGSCTVAENGDGTKTISCQDGTSVNVSDGEDGEPGLSALPCSISRQWDGTKLISCGGTAEVVSDGPPGPAGANGLSCWDLDGNGACDPVEDTNGDGTCSVLDCQGMTGAIGPAGPNGAPGAAGLSTLIAMTSEPAGSHCPAGGERLETGLDVNRNGVLDSGEVTATRYLCNGTGGGSGPGPSGDTTPPSFNGADMAVVYSDRYVTLTWSPATDDVSPASMIVYDICVSRTSGGCASNFLVADTSDPGATMWNVGNLARDTTHHFVVRARDQAGNRDDNLIELQAQPKLPNAQHALAMGRGHSCALLSDGTVRCWGSNMYEQLGDGTTTDRPTPGAVTGLTGVVALAGGDIHTCALLTNGTVDCWGYNWSCALGADSGTVASTPVAVSEISNAVALSAGSAHTCALLANGTVRCWGDNFFGQLGDGTTTNQRIPVAVPGLGSVVALVTGYRHNCALLANGAARCWGSNHNGQLGDGTDTGGLPPVAVSEISNAVALTAGHDHSCALLANGKVRCWGYNHSGQVGDGTPYDKWAPVEVSDLSNAVALTAGRDHTCALLADGAARCWGNNEFGQLGDGTTTSRLTPVTVQRGQGSMLSLGSGPAASHTCAVTADGTALCWGRNDDGEVGTGTATTSSPFGIAAPVQVSGLLGVAY